MKSSFKLASLAALTAATLALPVAAQEMQGSMKCHPKSGEPKCGAKCGAGKSAKSAKCGAEKKKKAMKCAAKCAPKCAAKCAAKK